VIDIVLYQDIMDLAEQNYNLFLNFRVKVKGVYSIKNSLYYERSRAYLKENLLDTSYRTIRKFYGSSVQNISETILDKFVLNNWNHNTGDLTNRDYAYYFYSNANTAALRCGDHQFLLLCDVVIGKHCLMNSLPELMTLSELNDNGYDSIFSPAKTNLVDISEQDYVSHDEAFLIYHPYQAIPVYLIEFEKRDIFENELGRITEVK
jgi:hypothetical protein